MSQQPTVNFVASSKTRESSRPPFKPSATSWYGPDANAFTMVLFLMKASCGLVQLEEVRKAYSDATDNVYDVWGDSYMRKWLLEVRRYGPRLFHQAWLTSRHTVAQRHPHQAGQDPRRAARLDGPQLLRRQRYHLLSLD